MSSKKKNSVEEPAEVYGVTPKNEVTSEELHPVLIQLIEKSMKEADEGMGIPHEEAMRRIKLRYSFLK